MTHLAMTLSKLASTGEPQEVFAGLQRPDCASEDTESNGSSEWRCRECDHRWGFEGGRSGEPYGFR